jgi:hypothetical protein
MRRVDADAPGAASAGSGEVGRRPREAGSWVPSRAVCASPFVFGLGDRVWFCRESVSTSLLRRFAGACWAHAVPTEYDRDRARWLLEEIVDEAVYDSAGLWRLLTAHPELRRVLLADRVPRLLDHYATTTARDVNAYAADLKAAMS